jgi:hypothetical protein
MKKEEIIGQNLTGKAENWFKSISQTRNYHLFKFEDLKEEFESLFYPLEDKNIISYKRLRNCKQRNLESDYDFANRFLYIVSLTNIDPTIQYCLFKSNLRNNIKDKLNEESFNYNIKAILPIRRKIKSKLIKILPLLTT